MGKRHILAMAIACSGCGHANFPSARELSPEQLNSHPNFYHQRSVVVRGYLTLAPAAHNIYESEALALEFERRWTTEDPSFDPSSYDKYCLTIANPGLFGDKAERFNGMTITMKGKFISDYLDGKIDLGACALSTGFFIDANDLRRRYPSIFAD